MHIWEYKKILPHRKVSCQCKCSPVILSHTLACTRIDLFASARHFAHFIKCWDQPGKLELPKKSLKKSWSTCKQRQAEERKIRSHVMQTHHESSMSGRKVFLQRGGKSPAQTAVSFFSSSASQRNLKMRTQEKRETELRIQLVYLKHFRYLRSKKACSRSTTKHVSESSSWNESCMFTDHQRAVRSVQTKSQDDFLKFGTSSLSQSGCVFAAWRLWLPPLLSFTELFSTNMRFLHRKVTSGFYFEKNGHRVHHPVNPAAKTR